MKVFIIAGEQSGDLHGAKLIQSLKSINQNYRFIGCGGDAMLCEELTPVFHIRDMAFMGFIEVIKNIFKIYKIIAKIKSKIIQFSPDVIILIDYPGMNMRLAKWAKKRGYKIVYYITPQIWAWHTSRVHNFVKYTDLRISILPFEQAFFKSFGYDVEFVSHPILDQFPEKNAASIDNSLFNNIALFPGSRKQEIEKILPIMLRSLKNSNFNITIAGLSQIGLELYQKIIDKENPKVNLVIDNGQNVLQNAHLALITSGTATLEACIHQVPQIVCYKTSKLNYILGRMLIKVPYISLVNIIASNKVIEELIQDDCNSNSIKDAIEKTINKREQIISGYKIVNEKIGKPGASDRIAGIINNFLKRT